MKTISINGSLIIAVVFFSSLCMYTVSDAQERSGDRVRVSPNAAVSQTIGTTDVTITYGRPAVRDRVIFGDLVPFNAVWRTGANEATTITFSDDVKIEGESLGAGTYGLFTIPQDNNEWTIIFNNVADQWGSNNYDSNEDALRVRISSGEAPKMEQMIFYFENIEDSSGDAVFHWDNVRFSFKIEEG